MLNVSPTENHKRTLLGVSSSGKARNKLHNVIMFDMALKLNLLTCFRCKLQIESVDEFSIDHKIPYLYGTSALFWDLDNIAFSHKVCNSKASRVDTDACIQFKESRRRRVKDGFSFCSKCKIEKEVENFGKVSAMWNGLNSICKKCRSERRKVLYDINKK